MEKVYRFSRESSEDSYVSHSRIASVRHLNQPNFFPGSSSENPYHEPIESFFSRLSMSNHNAQLSHPGLNGDIFVGSNAQFSHPGLSGDIFAGSIPDRSLVPGQSFSVQNMGQNLQNNGLNDYMPVGFQDCASYPATFGSSIDLRDNFLSGSLLSPNVTGFSRFDSRGISNFSTTGSFPKTQNSSRPTLYNRSPLWLQEPSNYVPLDYLDYLKGRIVRLAKDQNGCKILQKLLDSAKLEVIIVVFSEVIDHVDHLMVDPFGNYVVQKLVDVCNDEQRTQILLSVTKTELHLVRICLNMHGTRAVQKLLERIARQEQINLVISALTPGVVALATDTNGQHVIKHCFDRFSDEDNKYLLNRVADNCFQIATDKSGCCVIQQCVESSCGEQREHLAAEIIKNALLLAEDQYGNYVIQHLLGLRIPHITENLIKQLEGSYAALACNKYGSNVVEKFMLEAREDQSTQIVLELLRSSNASMLLVDPYGNFVIQTAISVSKGRVLGALLELIEINMTRMRNNIFGRKVMEKLRRERLLYP